MYGPQISPWTHTMTLMTQSRHRKKQKNTIFFYGRIHVCIVPFSCFISIFIPQRRRRARNSFGNQRFLFFSSFLPCVSFFLMRNDQVYGQSTGTALLLLARAQQQQRGKKNKNSNRVKGQQPFRNGLFHHQTFFFFLFVLLFLRTNNRFLNVIWFFYHPS